MIPIVFFVILITFFLMHLAPGSPWAAGRLCSRSPRVTTR
jgi:ABC-type dipeptide/oligopeptide/nickel transport system permease component